MTAHDHAAFVDGCFRCDLSRGETIPDAAVEAACEVMHDAYEAAAIEAGWETQARSRVAWADVPEANKATMRAAVSALIPHLTREADEAIAQADNLAGDVAALEREIERWKAAAVSAFDGNALIQAAHAERDEALAEVEQVIMVSAVRDQQMRRVWAMNADLRAERDAAHAAGYAEGVAAVKAAVEGLAEAALVNASVYELTEASVDVEDLYTALASVDGGGQ